MDSSDNHLSQSLDFYHLHKHTDKEPDENSNFKEGYLGRGENKFPSTAENRSAIYCLLKRI